MRRIFALFFILFASFSLFASWNVGFDLRAIDTLWSDSMRFDIEGGYRFKDIRISALLSYGSNSGYELSYIDGGLSVSIYPFSSLGFNIGCSVFRVGKMLGLAAPDESIIFSSEAFVGWTVALKYVYIEPRLSFNDTLSQDSSSMSLLRKGIEQYSRFRLSLLVGVGI